MLNSCKVHRNTRTREIDQVVIDRPFTDERANVIYNYFRSIGIPIHLGKEVMREELKKRGFNVDLEVAGWHGSPHYIKDGFRTDRIGTGEGAQRFGWGLYFTELWDIARGYAKALAFTTFKGEKIDDVAFFEKLLSGLDATDESFYDLDRGTITDLDKFRQYIKDSIDSLEQSIPNINVENQKYQDLADRYTYQNMDLSDLKSDIDIYEHFKKVANDSSDKNDMVNKALPSFKAKADAARKMILEVNKGKKNRNEVLKSIVDYDLRRAKSTLNYYKYIDNNFDEFNISRNLYKVTLHKGKTPDQYTWLEWDAVVDQKIIKKITEGDSHLTQVLNAWSKGEVYPATSEGSELTGKNLYKYLEGYFGSAKEASLFLLEKGIDGNKYPAETISRGATRETARGFNYVVFDENAITIEEHTQFLSTPSGEVYGFVTSEGEMFLDPDIAGVNTLIHEGAHIQYKVLKTAAERGDVKAQAILNKIQELTEPAVETIFNAKKAQERSSDSMPSVDMQAEQSIIKKMPELTELANKNIQIIKDYDRYQRILQKQAEGRRVLKTDRAFLDSHPELKNTPILDFGTPSDILRSVGITNPIKISMSHINRKLVGKEAHELTLLDLQDLMRAIHNPATVNKGAKGRVQLLTNHTNSNGAPIVVVLDNNYKKNTASITTAYALNNLTKVVPETSQDVLYTNNKRLADFLSDYSESKNRGFGIALFSYPEYDSSSDIIKYTQEKTNPKIEFDVANIRKIIENTKYIINKTNVSRVDFQIERNQTSSIFDSEGNLNIEELNRIVENNLITTNLTENEKEGLQRASEYAMGIAIIGREVENIQGSKGNAWVEETTRRAIEEYSRGNQKIWTLEEIEQDYEQVNEGSESVVYKSKDNTHVIKKLNTSKSDFNFFDYVFDRIVIHNTLFTDTSYEIVGLTEEGDLILRQPFYEGPNLGELVFEGELESYEEALDIIDKEVRLKFNVQREVDGFYFVDDYVLTDINPFNVIQTSEGRFIIDSITFLQKDKRESFFLEIEQDLDFQIIGEQGAQRVQEYADSLSKAKELEQEGIPYDQIEIQTGWYKYEGQWRTIPSEVQQNLKIEKYETNTILPLREVLVDENPLFEFYPELQEISVVFVEEGKPDTPQNLPKGFENSEGLYEEATKTIFLPTMVQDKRQTDTGLEYNLGHEVQHVISEIEGFPKGGDYYSVLKEAADIIGVENIESISFLELFNLLKNADTSELTPNERDILVGGRYSILDIMRGELGNLHERYLHIVGEIDANTVMKAMELRDRGETEVSFSEALKLMTIDKNINLNNVFLLRNGDVRFSLEEPQLAFEAAELSSPAYNQREGETDEQYKERLREEVFARALGDNAEQYLKDLGFTTQEAKTFLQKVQEFLAEIVDWLRGKKGLQDLSVDEINRLSIREFLDRSTTSMMLGEFKNVKGESRVSIDKITDPTVREFFGENVRGIIVDGSRVGTFIVEEIDGLPNVVRVISIKEEERQKGIAKEAYLQYVRENGEILSGQFYEEGNEVNSFFSEDAKRLWDSLKRDYNVEIISLYNYKRYKLSLKNNPELQQPQTAVQGSAARQGVQELFESNPELANEVYEALWGNSSISKIIEEEISIYNRFKGSNYFKDNPSDMFSPNFMRESVEEINPNEVILTEQGQSEERLREMGEYKIPEYGEYSTEYPIAFKYNDKIYLLDGHHRITLAKRSNIDKVKIAVKNIKFDFVNKLTPQQKQQAQQLYQSFLDVYLQDFEQVESVLKEEKIIDKKCS